MLASIVLYPSCWYGCRDVLSFVFQEVDAEDERALEMFLSRAPPTRRTLADIIQEKITEKQTEIHSQLDGK